MSFQNRLRKPTEDPTLRRMRNAEHAQSLLVRWAKRVLETPGLDKGLAAEGRELVEKYAGPWD